jgi:hypothetical protein
MPGDESHDPLIGSKLGPCRIEMKLAAGGMGTVYRARHLVMGDEVAVKILAPSLAQDQEYVTRFFREAGAAGQIDHPNVVRVIDVGKHDDRYYLVMEYVSGETLDQVVERERKLPLERATRVVREIAAGLAAAHRSGIIHRDVKPGNIIMSPDGRPHLTDFGLARHSETKKGLTIEGTFLGTPEYSSPEQVEGRKLDHRTDLYSLGVTYYQLLSGTLPFLGESPMEIAIKRTKEAPRPLENAFPGADPRACGIVNRLLSSEAGQRYQSATDLIRDLDAILAGDKPPALGKGPDTTKALRSGQADTRARRKALAFFHWDLAVTAVMLAFLSGGLAERGGSFLSAWAASDALFALRLGLAVAAAGAAAVSVLLHRRGFDGAGWYAGLSALLLLMLLGGVWAGTMIERSEASGAVGTLAASLRALLGHAGDPANLLAFALVLLLAAAVFSYEHEPGSHRVFLSRILVFGAFVLSYLLGTGSLGALEPLRNFMGQPELSIPLTTATALAAVFGLIMLTGYDFERVARTCGLLLALGASAGFFSIAALVGQPARQGWVGLLGEPLGEAAHGFGASGALLAVVAALGVAAHATINAAYRSKDRFVRRK